MNDAAVWLTEADVAEVLDMHVAITAVADAFRAQARGDVVAMQKTHVRWNSTHTLHAIGAVSTAQQLVATKTWAHTSGGAAPLLVLWDAGSGALRAVVEAFVLGQFRTAAVSGVATDLLAPPGPVDLAMLGSGRQALPQVAAVAAVRDVGGVRVFSPTAAHRETFATRVEDELGLSARACATVADAADGASVVTLATRARRPVLDAATVGGDAHVNAIGAITPERVEMSPDLVARADLVVVDDRAAAGELAAELAGRADLVELCALIDGGTGRPSGADVTVFKALGSGLADLALGAVCLTAATERGLGRPLPERRPAPGRFRPTARATKEKERWA